MLMCSRHERNITLFCPMETNEIFTFYRKIYCVKEGSIIVVYQDRDTFLFHTNTFLFHTTCQFRVMTVMNRLSPKLTAYFFYCILPLPLI